MVKHALLLATFVAAAALPACGLAAEPAGAPPNPEDAVPVTRVVDGDTIHVALGGRDVTVRYIGMDTPETVDPRRPVQRFGKEASERNRQLVQGKTVRLERDVSETDRFGRLLRYVWVDGQMVNATLVEEGFARSASYPPDVKHQELFRRLEREARAAKRGLWGDGP
jgi:micrococcal nuclease